MRISIQQGSINKIKTDLLIMPVSAAKNSKSDWDIKQSFNASVLQDLEKISGSIKKQCKKMKFSPAAGKRLDIIFLPSSGISLLRLSGLSAGANKPQGKQLNEWRRLFADAYNVAKKERVSDLVVCLHSIPSENIPAIVRTAAEGIKLAAYEFNKFKGRKSEASSLKNIRLLVEKTVSSADKQALQIGEARADGVSLARDLVNTPPSDLLPRDIVDTAKHIARKSRGALKTKIINRAQLKKLKAGGILAVSRGSDSEPFLIHMQYQPKGRSKGAKKYLIIGKGITFDSGGLSIKTGKGMEDMKCDMAGAACVISALQTISRLPKEAQPKHEVHLLVPTCENMINAKSIKPGDVCRAMNGKTVEVLNTDAEGRLILADALSYASRLKPDVIIDLATLTGACVVALGSEYAGMFSNDQKLADKLKEVAERNGELLWQLPLAEEYRSQLDSAVADLRNIGTGGPGAILGAIFLKEFVPANTSWVHLDIAGPAFDMKGNEYIKKGASGFGVLMLVDFLTQANS